MPSPQASKASPASSAESEGQPDGKGKGQISHWNRRSSAAHHHHHPYLMVNPSASFTPSTYLRALLQDNKQAVVIHPLSRDNGSQSSVLHLAPSSSSSILNVQPTRLFPMVTKHKQHPTLQGMKPGSLGWVQHESSAAKRKKSFLKCSITTLKNGKKTHLYSEHRVDDKTTVQCLIQRERVHSLEEQLAMEKQRLHEMQSLMVGKLGTAHLSKQRDRSLLLHPSHYSGVPAWPGLDFTVPLQEGFPDTVLALRRQLWEGGSVNIFHNMTNCIDYYKTNNVRPPFTYASLIRWAILESPQKQLALNEIYQWFTKMFAFFRLNKVTWKNAVRHNLSLHKCFVRVENIKGAVWMVDELEFQRKRGVRGSR
uniref:Fork-head domain-containing protein n=2 Tax=Pyxicephalus adspersus TaxID=30357 RepID=A0AAV3AI09_PYXAD|nr:TPA: hypothetical protein GDO54_018261 [Pyxicephalus adspersus]